MDTLFDGMLMLFAITGVFLFIGVVADFVGMLRSDD